MLLTKYLASIMMIHLLSDKIKNVKEKRINEEI